MKFCCLQHVPFEGPALIADWIASRKGELTSVPLYAGALPPDPASVDGVIIMGGPMNIYQYRDHPWLRDEARFVERALGLGKKAVGVCLGAQILANLLGARVFQNAEREIGWFPIRFTDEARKRLPSLPAEQTVLHWHGDTFNLPPGATRLAVSDACPEQGFLYQDQALALQFHMEMPEKSQQAIIEACRDELTEGRYVQSEETILTQSTLHTPAAEKLMARLLDDFLGT